VDTDGLIDFFTEAGRLKRIPRTGWVECGVPDPESVADHSFRVALMAMILAEERGLDVLRVVKMALIHDLAEAETGDLTPVQKDVDPQAAKRREDEVMKKLAERLPNKARVGVESAWREFAEGATPEARLVKDADKLEMVIQASEYEGTGCDKKRLMRFWHAEIVGDDAQAIRDAVKRRSQKPSR
jgi:putative hydrolase of HD superfamily